MNAVTAASTGTGLVGIHDSRTCIHSPRQSGSLAASRMPRKGNQGKIDKRLFLILTDDLQSIHTAGVSPRPGTDCAKGVIGVGVIQLTLAAALILYIVGQLGAVKEYPGHAFIGGGGKILTVHVIGEAHIAVNDGRIMIPAGRKYQLHQEADRSRFRTRMNPVGAHLGANIESLDLHKLGLGRQGTVLKLYGSPVQLGTASFPAFRCFDGGTVLKCEEVGQPPEDLILRYVKIILIHSVSSFINFVKLYSFV